MNPESLTAEAIPAVIPSRGWRLALIASVLLHLLVLAVLLQLRPGAIEVNTRPASLRHVVAMVARPPAIEEKTVPLAPLTTRPAAPPDAIEPARQLPAPVATIADKVEANPGPAPPAITTLPQGQGTLTQDKVRTAISTFSATYKAELSADWLSECMRYRERYPRQECPLQQPQDTSALDEGTQIAESVFAGVTRIDRYQRLTESMLEENDRLETLVEQGGVLGSLARERYFLNREYVFYLNGNFNFGAWNFVKISNAGNGNLEFMRSFMQFQCKESPCLYEFTGIGAKPDASSEAESASANETAPFQH